MAALPRRHYKRVFEPGCSIGVLTRMLAERAESVVASDVSLAALETARRSGLPGNVQLDQAVIPHQWPPGRFDLIVFSELGYYFDEADLDTFISRAASCLDGDLIAVHWRPPVFDYPGDAARVHEALAASGLHRLACYEEELFLLDLFAVDTAAGLPIPEPEQEAEQE